MVRRYVNGVRSAPSKAWQSKGEYPRAMTPSNVESFNLDHRTVSAPYVRIADRKELPGGDVLVKYDIRFSQPNVSHLEMPTVHSIEHLTAELMRNHTDRLIDFSPMGCQTGFYALMLGVEYREFLPILAAAFADILNATEVPAANEVQCGWGASHTLTGAQDAVRAFLSGRDVWDQVSAAPASASFTTGYPGPSRTRTENQVSND